MAPKFISESASQHSPIGEIFLRANEKVIKLKVLDLLEKKGHTKYWLYKQLGMSYQNFSKMVNNETKSIRYENIETICLLLECTPNELFEITIE